MCAVCFRSCNGNLRTCKCVEYIVCFTRDGGTDYVDNSHCADAFFFAKAQCRKAVCGLTGLADDHCQSLLIQNRITITELRCKLYTNRYTYHIFKHILCCHAYMISRSAGNDIYLADLLNFFIGKSYLRKINLSVFNYGIQGISDCFWLLMDFFHHEMLETCFFGCLCIPINCLHFFLDFFAVQIVESDLTFADTGHLQVADIIHISCIFQNCRNIGCYIGFSVSYTKDHRAVFTCHIDFFRIIFKHDCKCIGTTNTNHSMVDCIDWCSFVFFVIVIYKFDSYFCICL